MAKTAAQLDAERKARIETVKTAAETETTRVHGNAAKGSASTSMTMEVASDIDGEKRTARAKYTSGIETDETGPAPAPAGKPTAPAGGDKPATPAAGGGDKGSAPAKA